MNGGLNMDSSLIFIHMPKAAGTTMIHLLRKNFPRRACYHIKGNIRRSIARFKKEAMRKEIRFLFGHMPFGLHNYMSGSARYYTMLRDPVKRVISHYNFALRNSSHYLHKHALNGLAEYLKCSATAELANGQTQLIIGKEQLLDERADSQKGRRILEQARRIIRNHFLGVGITELFDESLMLLNREVGLRNLLYYRQNVRRSEVRVSKKELMAIRRMNELDHALYAHYRGIVEDSLSESIMNELYDFRKRNRRYQQLALVYKLPVKMLKKILR